MCPSRFDLQQQHKKNFGEMGVGNKRNQRQQQHGATAHAYRISNARLLLAARWPTDGQVPLGREGGLQQKSNGRF